MTDPTSLVPELSVIVPVSETVDDVRELFREYIAALNALGRAYELIAVVDGGRAWIVPQLQEIRRESDVLSIVVLGRTYGEAAALSVGFQRARADLIVTLPAYEQVDPADIGKLLPRLDEGADLVIGRRHPRIDSMFNRLQSKVFHGFVRSLTRSKLKDISCGLKAMRREVTDQLEIYGDLHRFIPIIAANQGFSVVEQSVRQSERQSRLRFGGLGAYPRRLLDLLTVFFLFKFTRKPLRFFGLVGTALFASGGLITAYLGFYRLLGFGAIGQRPLLLLGVLLMVLGFQTLSIGLLGEIIIFVHARELPVYSVAEIIASRDDDLDQRAERSISGG